MLSKVNQTVDYKSFRKCTFVFVVFQGRTKTNEHFSKIVCKSSFLSKVNQTVDCNSCIQYVAFYAAPQAGSAMAVRRIAKRCHGNSAEEFVAPMQWVAPLTTNVQAHGQGIRTVRNIVRGISHCIFQSWQLWHLHVSDIFVWAIVHVSDPAAPFAIQALLRSVVVCMSVIVLYQKRRVIFVLYRYPTKLDSHLFLFQCFAFSAKVLSRL